MNECMYVCMAEIDRRACVGCTHLVMHILPDLLLFCLSVCLLALSFCFSLACMCMPESPLYAQAQLYEAQAHHLFGIACSKLAYEVSHFSHRQQLQTAALTALDHAATIDADNADVIFHLALVHADVRKVHLLHTYLQTPFLATMIVRMFVGGCRADRHAFVGVVLDE
jgi:hypothetical protein